MKFDLTGTNDFLLQIDHLLQASLTGPPPNSNTAPIREFRLIRLV